MAATYEQERKDAKADIEAAGATGYILDRVTLVQSPCSFLILTYSTFDHLGGLVADNDAKLMTPALGIPIINPELHDVVINDARPDYASSVGTYQIISPNPFQPGGIAVYYDLQVRKR